MEGPLLSKSDPIHGDSSSDDEHIVNITINTDSSSANDQTVPHDGTLHLFDHPHDIDAIVWNLVEFIVTLIQIVATIVVLNLTNGERQKILVRLIISYTCGCIANLPVLVWRFWYYTRVISDTSLSLLNKVVENLRIMIGYFFVGWITVLVWFLINNSASQDYTTPHTWLCLAFLVNSCIQHVFRNFRCSMICFMLPLLPRIAEVYEFIDDIDEKLTYLGIAFAALVLICNCICKCEK